MDVCFRIHLPVRIVFILDALPGYNTEQQNTGQSPHMFSLALIVSAHIPSSAGLRHKSLEKVAGSSNITWEHPSHR